MHSLINKLLILAVIVTSVMTVQLNQVQTTEAADTCWQLARLTVGGTGRVTTYPYLANRIRSNPSYSASIIGRIPPGGLFTVVGNAICGSGAWWWLVNYNGTVGWTVEGNGSTQYYLEPIVAPPPPGQFCALTPRLTVGGYGRVTPGLPNVVRSAPGTQSTGSNSLVIGQIPGGGVFNVLAGPQCGTDRRWWWQVNYNGLVGWTAEGEGSTYWVEPASGTPVPTVVAATFQTFEGGYMLWLSNTGWIWVLDNNGVVTGFVPASYGYLPENPIIDAPPFGRFKPIQGFGKVWGHFPAIRSRMGWATEWVRSYVMTMQQSAPGQYRISFPDGRFAIVRETGTWNFTN